jgi:predicted RNase H-like nuclease (RuvC/YqgF family)
MNYNNLSVKELIHYLDLYNDDPLVRRLVVLLREESLVEELEEVGMDPNTKTFRDEGWDYRGPGEYIEHLRNDVDYYVREADELRTEVHNLEKEVARLSARGVASLLAEVHDTLESAKMEEGRYRRMAEHEKKLREEAEQKFEFWDKLHYGIK